MKTNFFELIAGLNINGNLQMNVQAQEGGTLTVSVLLANTNPKITAGKNIPPMLLKGTIAELDEKFFSEISEPVKQTVKLFANQEACQAELDKARKQPEKAGGKTTASPAKKAADNSLFSQPAEPEIDDDDNGELHDDTEALAKKQRLYEEAMQRVGVLNTQMKYKEALAQLPDAGEYPDKADEIKTKREQLEKRQQLYASLQEI